MFKRLHLLVLCTAGVVTLGVASTSNQVARADEAPRPVAMSSGADLFAQNCVACHGAHGDGDGPAAAGLTPKPRQLSSKAVMAKISDDTIFNTIRKGGQAMGKSPIMPAFAALDDAQVKSLIAHIRSLCGCQYTK